MKATRIYSLLALIIPTVFFNPGTVEAHHKVIEVNSSPKVEMTKQLELMRQRIQFLTDTQPEMEVASDTLQYFSVKVSEISELNIHDNKPGNLVVVADGGVSQLVLETVCEKDNSLLFGKAKKCLTYTFVSEYVEEGGIRTFTVPVSYLGTKNGAELDVILYPCRFNGCFAEEAATFKYKSFREFADDLKIYDRYEWVYDWDGDTYHVQEVLLNFSSKEIKKIYVSVRCEAKGLYISTDQDHRYTCNQKRRIAEHNFRKEEIDEQGNKYRVLLESVTRNIQKENVGKVVMEFRFMGANNKILHIAEHRPVQLDTLEVEEVENN